jgi:uncharacterized membrane protein
VAAEPKWQHDISDHPDEWTDEDEMEWQEANASRFAPDDRQLGQILGLFSIGLGLAELIAPRAVGRAIGVGEHPAIMRMVGVREIVTGLGMLSERAPGAWAWARVAGDAMDLALLGAATSSPDADPRRIAAATAGVLGVTALDVYSGQRLTATQSAEAPRIAVTQTVTVNSAPDELYHFWKNLENLPLFMDHLESVSEVSERVSHWVAKAPAGTSVEWDAEIVEDLPNQRIAWKSVGDADVQNAGAVRFDDRGTSTNIEVSLEYDPPAGKAGELVAELFKDPDKQVRRAVDGFRQVVESGGLNPA